MGVGKPTPVSTSEAVWGQAVKVPGGQRHHLHSCQCRARQAFRRPILEILRALLRACNRAAAQGGPCTHMHQQQAAAAVAGAGGAEAVQEGGEVGLAPMAAAERAGWMMRSVGDDDGWLHWTSGRSRAV